VLGPVFWDLAFQPCLEMLNEMQQVETVWDMPMTWLLLLKITIDWTYKQKQTK